MTKGPVLFDDIIIDENLLPPNLNKVEIKLILNSLVDPIYPKSYGRLKKIFYRIFKMKSKIGSIMLEIYDLKIIIF